MLDMPGRLCNSRELARHKKLGVAVWTTAYWEVLTFSPNKTENRKTGKVNRLKFRLLQVSIAFQGLKICHLENARRMTELQDDRMTERQNDRTTKWQNDRMTERQNDRTTKWQNDRMTEREVTTITLLPCTMRVTYYCPLSRERWGLLT